MRWFTNMVHKSKKTHAFTLVEVIIVVVIVGVLAAVALSLYRGYTRKAMATEATAGLGTIRTALRVMYAQHQDYTNGGIMAAEPVAAQVPGIATNDLNGTYFDHDNYSITAIDVTSFLLDCTGDADSGDGNQVGRANGINVTMDHLGKITGP